MPPANDWSAALQRVPQIGVETSNAITYAAVETHSRAWEDQCAEKYKGRRMGRPKIASDRPGACLTMPGGAALFPFPPTLAQ